MTIRSSASVHCDYTSPTTRLHCPEMLLGRTPQHTLDLARLAGWQIGPDGHYCRIHKKE